MYGDVANLDVAPAETPADAVAWLAGAAGHGRQRRAGCVQLRDGRWIDLDAEAPRLLARLSDPVAKPAAWAELLELHAADVAATTWRADDDDWPA